MSEVQQEQHFELGMVHACGFGLWEAFNISLDESKLPPEARTLCEAADRMVHSEVDIEYTDPRATRDRLGYVLYLDALLTSPDVVMAAIKRVREDLVHGDPMLALLK